MAAWTKRLLGKAPEDPIFTSDMLRRLLIPLLLEQALVVAIGMMDTMMVSSCGEASVSGVSLVDSINNLLIQVFSALCTGGAVVTSQFLGKRDIRSAGDSAKQLFYAALGSSVLIMVFCLVLRRALLSLIFGSIEDSVMQAAQVYFLMTALSYPFLAGYSASAALLRSQGNTKYTLYISLVMNIVNVAGNAVTIFGLGMGAAGAGLATLISRVVGDIMGRMALRQPGSQIPAPVLHELEWKPDLIQKILRVGIPNGLENGLFQLGKLLLLSMVATFGTASVAANAVGSTIAGFQCLPGNAFSLAMITVVGQCVGARRYDQATYYTKKLMLLVYLTMGSWNLLILACNGFICKPFNLSPETEQLARLIAAIHGAGCVFFWPMSFVLPNSLRAAGDAAFTMRISTLSMLVFRIFFGYLMGMTLGMGVIGVWLAMQIDWYLRILHFVLRFRSGKWKTKTLV